MKSWRSTIVFLISRTLPIFAFGFFTEKQEFIFGGFFGLISLYLLPLPLLPLFRLPYSCSSSSSISPSTVCLSHFPFYLPSPNTFQTVSNYSIFPLPKTTVVGKWGISDQNEELVDPTFGGTGAYRLREITNNTYTTVMCQFFVHTPAQLFEHE